MQDVRFKITADGSQARSEVGKVKNEVSGLSKGMASMGNTLKGAIGAYVGINTIKSMVSAMASFADEIQNASDRLEMSTDNVQKLRIAGRHAGVELAKIETGFGKMEEFLKSAADGDPANSLLAKKLGLTDNDIRFQKDKFELARKIGSGILSNSSNKFGDSKEIFGKTGPSMMSMMPELLKNNFDGVVDKDVISQMDQLGDAFEDLKETVITGLLPSFVELVDWINTSIAGYRDASKDMDYLDASAASLASKEGNIFQKGTASKYGVVQRTLLGSNYQASSAYTEAFGGTREEKNAQHRKNQMDYLTQLYGETVAKKTMSEFLASESKSKGKSFMEKLNEDRMARIKADIFKEQFTDNQTFDRKTNENGSLKYWEKSAVPASADLGTSPFVKMGGVMGVDAAYRMEKLSQQANTYLEKIAKNSDELNEILKKNPNTTTQEYPI